MAPLYYATSLEQIAQLFDQQREKAVAAAKRSTTKRDREIQTAHAITWRDAAHILRNTELTKGEQP